MDYPVTCRDKVARRLSRYRDYLRERARETWKRHAINRAARYETLKNKLKQLDCDADRECGTRRRTAEDLRSLYQLNNNTAIILIGAERGHRSWFDGDRHGGAQVAEESRHLVPQEAEEETHNRFENEQWSNCWCQDEARNSKSFQPHRYTGSSS